MNLQEIIESDLKKALKEGDKLSLSVLRMVVASIKNEKIEKGTELNDEDLLNILKKAVKTRNQSVTEFTKGGRIDLADKEKSEIEVIKKYLPQELSDKEIEEIINQTINELGEVSQKEIGKVIGSVMKKTQGKADGGKVASLVKSKFQ